MKTILLAAILFAAGNANAQVGIGTQTPSANAVLDVSSSDKGLLLPRIADTGSVSNPSEGLMIYNRNTKAPAYHDGAKWNSVASAKSLTTDSLTYTITNATNPFTDGTFPASSFSNGITSTSANGTNKPGFQEVNLSKLLDANSVAFTKSAISSPINSGMKIEFRSYTPGAATPNYSIKLTTPVIYNYQVAAGTDGNVYENISLSGVIFGYKNWNTGFSYAWNIPGNASISY